MLDDSPDQFDLDVRQVLYLWDRGSDTLKIAELIRCPQHKAERLLHYGLERRRRDARVADQINPNSPRP